MGRPCPERLWGPTEGFPVRPRLQPNRWDLVTIPLVLGLLGALAWGMRQMTVPFQPGDTFHLSLDPWHLPEYALRTVLRMAGGLVMSFVFTFTYGALAAKSARAERILVPALDVLQSVPILGFLAITVTGFMAMFPGNLLGVEMASMFAIFTSQAWNMAFSFYQSLKMVPRDLTQAANLFGLSPWQRFWRLEVPFSIPGLVWNTMMSVSGGWFFVVASEAIAVGTTQVNLPGIGSYVAEAIAQRDLAAIGYALLAMLVVILAYDQVLFRPLVAWSQKFKFEMVTEEDEAGSWLLDWMRRTRLGQQAFGAAGRIVRRALFRPATPPLMRRGLLPRRLSPRVGRVFVVLVAGVGLAGTWVLYSFTVAHLGWGEVGYCLWLGFLTLVRVAVLIAIASVIWIPIGVHVGLRPRLASRVQPLAQFLAAFPANLFFPIAVLAIQRWDLSPEVFTAPLMVLGTQWYVLFNVVAGASALPGDLKEVARSMGLRRALAWKRLYLPALLPYLTTGWITASGGTWNASIVAEVVSWGETHLVATGLGSYIARYTEEGDLHRVVLGIVVMSLYVVTVERLVWRRLGALAENRFRLD